LAAAEGTFAIRRTRTARRAGYTREVKLVAHLVAGFLLAHVFVSCAPEPQLPARTVVLISLDTLRPERLGVYGNSADVSPSIDALARESVVFDRALTVAPWTLPSHMTMLTGLDPVAHGVETPTTKLSPKIRTVQQVFAENGFATAAFTSGGFAGPGWGLEKGFETFDPATVDDPLQLGFSRYLDSAVAWMESNRDKPYFLFLHSFDAHAPYDAADPQSIAKFKARAIEPDPRDHEMHRATYTRYARAMRFDRYTRINEVLRDYDAGVHDADRGVGRVIETLKRTGRYEDALIVVLSDHGESFYDHGLWIGHGLELTDSALRVPLIAKLPRAEAAGRRIATLVDLVDLAPTLLAAAELPPPAEFQGSSLLDVVRGGKRSRSYSLAGTYTTGAYSLTRAGLRFVDVSTIPPIHVLRHHIEPETPPMLAQFAEGEQFKRVGPTGEPYVTRYPNLRDPLGYLEELPFRTRLFDLGADPSERTDVSAERPKQAEDLRKALQAVLTASRDLNQRLSPLSNPKDLDQANIQQLQALGYAVGGEKPTDEQRSMLQQQMDELLASAPSRMPEAERLTAVDRALHELRLRLRQGQKLGASDFEELDRLANEAVTWLEKHRKPDYDLRVAWRVLEIQTLAQQAGGTFDIAPYIQRVRDIRRPQKR
jgi:arylsulfatase A-like enzyme